MISHLRSAAFAALTLFAFAGIAEAQAAANTPTPNSAFRSAGPLTPLKVQIVISRFQGDKKVSNLPYMIAVNANDGTIDPMGQYIPHGGPARLRMGAEVPVMNISFPKDLPGARPTGPVQYRHVGTNIDCTAHSTGDGRFRLTISIEDSSVYAEGQTAQGVTKLEDIPSFRSFQSSNTVILKVGQSTQFTAAADRINGEVTTIDVTLLTEK